jgi:hypothetical protein
MDFKTHFELSWKLFVANLAALLISTLVLLAVSVVSLGFMAPVMTAGYMQSLLLLVRENRKPEIRDLFGQMRLFFPLLIFTLVVALVIFLGLAMLVLPGIVVLIALTFFCMYMIPLMTDQNLGLVEAVKESGRMALQDPVGEHIAVIAVFLALHSIGNSTGIGILFTQPFATLFVLSVYELKRRRILPFSQEKADNQPPLEA